jgi:hypothetical protein
LEVSWREAGLLDLDQVRGADGSGFDLITCLGQTLPHLLEEADWLAFFRKAEAALEPGGQLVIQVVNDAGLAVGASRALPVLRPASGVLERVRTMLTEDQAQFETCFQPPAGPPYRSQVRHRRMGPERATELLLEAGLRPGPALADEAGAPFSLTSPGWLLVAAKI